MFCRSAGSRVMEKCWSEGETWRRAEIHLYDPFRAALIMLDNVDSGAGLRKNVCYQHQHSSRPRNHTTDITNTPRKTQTHLQQLLSSRSFLRLHSQTTLQPIPKQRRKLFPILDFRRPVGRNQIQRSQRILIQIRWLSFQHFYLSALTIQFFNQRLLTNRHDSQRPDINLWSIFLSRDHFRRHPIRRSNHCRPLGRQGIRNPSAKSEISCKKHQPNRPRFSFLPFPNHSLNLTSPFNDKRILSLLISR